MCPSGRLHHHLSRLNTLVIVQYQTMEFLSILSHSSSVHYEPGSECVEVLLLLLGTIIWDKHRLWEHHQQHQWKGLLWWVHLKPNTVITFLGNCCPDLVPALNSSFGMLTEIKNYAVLFCASHRNKQESTADFTRGTGLIMASTFLLLIHMQQTEVLRKLQCWVLTQCNLQTLGKALKRPKWELIVCFLLVHFPLAFP